MQKLPSYLNVLILVTAAMLFHKTKIPSSMCRIPLGTFVPSFVSIGKVVSEDNIFEINKIKNRKETLKWAITPTWLNGLKRKITHG